MSGVILQPLCANTTVGAARTGIPVLCALAALRPQQRLQVKFNLGIRSKTWSCSTLGPAPGQGCSPGPSKAPRSVPAPVIPKPNPRHRASAWLPLTQFPTTSLLPGALPETHPLPKCRSLQPSLHQQQLRLESYPIKETGSQLPWPSPLPPHGLRRWHQHRLDRDREICPFQQQQLLKISLNWSWNCTLGPTFHSHEVTSAGRAADRSGCVLPPPAPCPWPCRSIPIISSSKDWPGSTPTWLGEKAFSSQRPEMWAQRTGNKRKGSSGIRAGRTPGTAAQPEAAECLSRVEAAAESSG